MALVGVYRPGSEVFSDETLQSAAHRPVTMTIQTSMSIPRTGKTMLSDKSATR